MSLRHLLAVALIGLPTAVLAQVGPRAIGSVALTPHGSTEPNRLVDTGGYAFTFNTLPAGQRRLRSRGLDRTASAFMSREPVGSLFTLTSESDDFASGNAISTVGGTAQLSLDPANAYDNTYTVHYFVSVTINASSTFGTATLVVAIETNDGSGWVERATYS